MRMKKVIALSLASAMMLSVAACGNQQTSTGDAGQTASTTAKVSYPGTPDQDMVTVDLISEPPELNSLMTQDSASGDVLRLTVVGLYELDKNDNPVPNLATDTQVSEDGKTYTMKLKQGVKWSNGEEVTAHDFVFAYQTLCKKETAAPYGFMIYENLVNGMDIFEGKKDPSELGVKAIDDYTLEVSFVTPIPYATSLFSFYTFLPMNQKAYEEIGANNYAKDMDKIVTNGAYKFAEWVHDDHITLVKNPEYHKADEIKVEKVKYMMMKDANARMNAFKAAQLDSFTLSGDQKAQFEAEGGQTISFVDNSVWYLQYNTKVKAFSNPKIRKAFGLAIDTQLLCDSVLKDGSVVASGIVPSGIAGANGVKYREVADNMMTYDKELAKKMLEEGLAEEGMKLEDLKVSFLTGDTTGAQRDAAFYQEQWKQVLGVHVDVKPMPFKGRIQAMQEGNFDMVYAGWSADYDDPMTYLDLFTTNNGNNHGYYSNKEYDKLIKAAKVEPDVDKRQQMLMDAETLLLKEDAPIYPLYFRAQSYVLSDKLQGVTRTGFQPWDFTDGAEIVKK